MPKMITSETVGGLAELGEDLYKNDRTKVIERTRITTQDVDYSSCWWLKVNIGFETQKP